MTSSVNYICPRCGAKSHNPTDYAEGYCGFCHDYTGPSLEDRLPMVAVYDNPADYPGRFVARRYWIGPGGLITAEIDPIVVTENIAELRAKIPPGMVRLDPMPGDENTIMETWV